MHMPKAKADCPDFLQYFFNQSDFDNVNRKLMSDWRFEQLPRFSERTRPKSLGEDEG